MNLVDIINDRKTGEMAPSEILRRRKMKEARLNKSGGADDVKSKSEEPETKKEEVVQSDGESDDD